MDPNSVFKHDTDHDSIREQLLSTITQDLSRSLQIGRPLLTHLNADTTWLLSLPVPGRTRRENEGLDIKFRQRKDEGARSTVSRQSSTSEKRYFHILIDPWLRGGQSDVAQFFSQQWHMRESAVQTISEAEEVIARIEDLASSGDSSWLGTIDAVVISHEFTDHMHKETLLEVAASVPVFAASKAARIIRSWRHFHSVVTLPTHLGERKDWRSTSTPPLPPWLGISRLGQDRIDLLYYHAAVVIAFSTTDPGGDGERNATHEKAEAEAVVYTPHGISVEDLQPLTTAEPPLKALALLHGLHDVRMGPRLNLGAHNGLKLQRLIKAKYWVGTHDEVKRGGGLVSYFLTRDVVSVKQALERELQEKAELGELANDSLADVHYQELGNGESLLLG